MNIVNPFFLKNDPEGACQAITKEASDEWNKVIFLNIILFISI